MTKLLVSVRNWPESRIALRSGVDIVDLKEPCHGPLGVVDIDTASQVSHRWDGTAALSLALGELAHWSLAWQQQYPIERFQFAKIGLSHMVAQAWQTEWCRWQETLPASTQPVAVIYADWQRARSPTPTQLIDHALAVGCRTFLVDTFDKTNGTLLDHVSSDQLTRWGRHIDERQGMLVAAGSLTAWQLPDVIRTGVSVVGVRGGVCEAGRTSPISPSRIRMWRSILCQNNVGR